MSREDWYNSLFIEGKSANLKKEKLRNLYQVPKRPRKYATVRHSSVEKGAVHQADIIFMPDDDGYRYALVVCDVGGERTTDAEPLKIKSVGEVLQAFKTIYKRKILKPPKYTLQVDNGGEFKGDVRKYFKDKGIYIRYGKPDRHQNQASVEAKNYTIGKTLFMRMAAEELETEESTREWVEYVPRLIKALNKRLKKNSTRFTGYDKPVDATENEELIPEGTDVRVALDAPREVLTTGHKLHGKFRAGDIRWEKDPTEVKQILLAPAQPVMYLTERYPHTAYLAEQLQIVPEDENNPPESIIRKFTIEKLLNRKKVKNRIYFLVKWKNYPSSYNSWEPRTTLMEDAPELVLEYEKR